MQIPRQVHLATQVLPAIGFTNQALFDIPVGTRRLSFWITYTRGSGTSRPEFRMQWTDDTDEAREIVIDEGSFAAATPDANFNFFQSEPQGPVPPDANALLYVLEWAVVGGARQVRLIAAELGDQANPGTMQITLTGEGG